MKILFIRHNTYEYIAKIYWSLQNGLSKHSDLISFGKKQDVFNENIRDYSEIIKVCYKDGEYPDLVITDFNYNKLEFKYTGIENISCKKAMILGDYWAVPSRDKFINIVENKLDYVFTLFYDAMDRFSTIKSKMIFTPPSIDSEFFQDWKLNKEYDVGFLGSGCTQKKHYYRDRYRITELLKKRLGNRFYYDKHPGWGYFNDKHFLVGSGFSKAINKCKMFISTAGTIGHCNPKYYEIMASGSLLLAGRCNHLEKTQFQDGVNCVFFSNDDELLEKIEYYTIHEQERKEIIKHGMQTIEEYHIGEKRAKELLEKMKNVNTNHN